MTPMQQIEGYADLKLDVEVELGRKPIRLGQLMELKPNSVLRLDKSAGENIDVLIGGELIGRGELVVSDDSFGVRVTDFREEH